MKKFIIVTFFALILAFLASCQGNKKASPCKLVIYGSYQKVYQISFNGIDSIKTICGHVDVKVKSPYVDKSGLFDEKSFLESKDFVINPIYLHSSKKINKEQAGNLIAILNRLNSKVITDTIMGGSKDVWYIHLSLEKQNIFREAVDYKDKDLKLLVDSLIEYSPIFINNYGHNWFGLENELEMTRMFDHRKSK